MPPFERRRVQHMQPRQEIELDGLLGERECSGNDRLRGNDGRNGGEHDQDVVKPVGSELKERIRQRLRLDQQQCALPEIVEKQSGQNDPEPGKPDGAAAEMAHIGVECFPAGHCKEGGAEHGEGDHGWRM